MGLGMGDMGRIGGSGGAWERAGMGGLTAASLGLCDSAPKRRSDVHALWVDRPWSLAFIKAPLMSY